VQRYHPSRVLTLVYQTFAFGTLAVLAYNEAKIDTRRRNLVGYIIFFISTLSLLVVSLLFFGLVILYHFTFCLQLNECLGRQRACWVFHSLLFPKKSLGDWN